MAESQSEANKSGPQSEVLTEDSTEDSKAPATKEGSIAQEHSAVQEGNSATGEGTTAAGDEGSPSATDSASDLSTEGISQDDLDNIFGKTPGSGGVERAASSRPVGTVGDDSGEQVSPDDIDALMGAVGQEPNPSFRGDKVSSAVPSSASTVKASSRRARGTGIEAGSDSSSPLDVQGFEPQTFGETASPSIDTQKVTMLGDVNLKVRIELGRTQMLVEDVLRLGDGSVVELDKLAGDPVDVYVNNRLIARGEVLVLNDSFCVRVSEVLSHDPHRVSA